MPTGPLLRQTFAGVGTTNPFNLPATSPITAGSTVLILAIGQRNVLPDVGGGTAPTLTDSLGNVITAITVQNSVVDWTSVPLRVWAIVNSLGGADTFHFAGAGITAAAVWEFSPFTFFNGPNPATYPTSTVAHAGATAAQLFDLELITGAIGSVIVALGYADGASGFNGILTVDGDDTNGPNVIQTSSTPGAGSWESADKTWGHAFIPAPQPANVQPAITGVDHTYGLNVQVTAVALSPGVATYSYSIIGGTAALYVGQVVTITGMALPGNNGTFTINAIPGLGGAGTFDVTRSTQGNAVGQNGSIHPAADFSREWVWGVAFNLATMTPLGSEVAARADLQFF